MFLTPFLNVATMKISNQLSARTSSRLTPPPVRKLSWKSLLNASAAVFRSGTRMIVAITAVCLDIKSLKATTKLYQLTIEFH